MCVHVGLQVPVHVLRSEEGMGPLTAGVRGLRKAQCLRDLGLGGMNSLEESRKCKQMLSVMCPLFLDVCRLETILL